MDRLSASDLINLAAETRDTPMNVGALAILDGRALRDPSGLLRLEALRSVIGQRLDRALRLRQIVHTPGLFAGRPLWIDDAAFRVERHVVHIDLPAPGDDKALLELAARLLARPLDRKHPLWRLWFVTGLHAGQVGLILAMHHVVADGLAAMRLVTSLLDPHEPSDPPADSGWVAQPKPTWRELVHDNLQVKLEALRKLVSLRNPRELLGSVWAQGHLFTGFLHAPRTSLNAAAVGPHRRLAVVQIDLAGAKEVAHRHDGKVNDVILSLAAAGLRALLLSRNEHVDGIWLHANVAVSLRSPDQGVEEAGNRTGGIIVRLPLGEPDPRQRLRLVAAGSADAKHHQIAATGDILLASLGRLGLLRYFSRRQHMTNLVESNVIGSPTTISLLGAPVLDLVPVGVLVGNLAVSFLALSYAGSLTITVQADADLLPDLPVLVAAMKQDWATMVHGEESSPARAGQPSSRT